MARKRSSSSQLLRAAWISVAVAAAFLAVASIAIGKSWRSCSGSYDTQGSYSRLLNFWTHIREHNVSCRSARSVAHGYIVQTGGSPGSLFGQDAYVGAFTCSGRLIQTPDNPYGKVTCWASNYRRVTFKGVS